MSIVFKAHLPMYAHIQTVCFQGVKVIPVTVELVIASGLPGFNIVGLADRAVVESKERIRACFHTLSLALPPKRITINLSPADMPKDGSHFDLAIALAVLVGIGVCESAATYPYITLGELSLDGRINRCTGIIPAALYAHEYNKGLICPQANACEAGWTGLEDVLAPANLISFINHFLGTQMLTQTPTPPRVDQEVFTHDMSDVKGQIMAKRGLEIAAAGGHHVLMSGQPGVGKSMLAQRLPSILPPLTPQESLEVSALYSIAGLLPDTGFVYQRPYRDPHHSTSTPALVGGGSKAKPGEISLAHHGVLFLDELPEFSRQSLESLRQPMESGTILLGRVNHHIQYPAKFQLIAAMNPCRCGHLGNLDKQCGKAPLCGQEYQNKLSGPLMDRFDLRITMQTIQAKELWTTDPSQEKSETSDIIRQRVKDAVIFQQRRQQSIRNCELDGTSLQNMLANDPRISELLEVASHKMQLSARSMHKILRVSRTIADLNHQNTINYDHILEALQFRMLS